MQIMFQSGAFKLECKGLLLRTASEKKELDQSSKETNESALDDLKKKYQKLYERKTNIRGEISTWIITKVNAFSLTTNFVIEILFDM